MFIEWTHLIINAYKNQEMMLHSPRSAPLSSASHFTYSTIIIMLTSKAAGQNYIFESMRSV